MGRGGKGGKGGMFAVGSKERFDRFIYDRRPRNATDVRFNWARLPHGLLFTRVIPSRDNGLKGHHAGPLSLVLASRSCPSQPRVASSVAPGIPATSLISSRSRAPFAWFCWCRAWAT